MATVITDSGAKFAKYCLNKLTQENTTSPNKGEGARGSAIQCVSILSGLALLTIGCIGALGILPGSTMGWLAIGLGSGGLAFNLACGKLKKRKTTLLIHAALVLIPVVLGSLGAAGILSGAQVGWGITGSYLALFGVAGGLGCCVYKHKHDEDRTTT